MRRPISTRSGIVDVDVHPVPRDADEIRRHMPMPFRERYRGERRAIRGFRRQRARRFDAGAAGGVVLGGGGLGGGPPWQDWEPESVNRVPDAERKLQS